MLPFILISLTAVANAQERPDDNKPVDPQNPYNPDYPPTHRPEDPCELWNWIQYLGGRDAAGSTAFSTAEVCKRWCPKAEDRSMDFMMPDPFAHMQYSYSTGQNPGQQPLDRGVCIVASEIFVSDIELTKFDDCLFVCRARSNHFQALEGDDKIWFKHAYNNKVDASDGKDFIYAEEGVHNTFVGGPDDDQIAVVGKDNYLYGDEGKDITVAVGEMNHHYGGAQSDVVVNLGNNGMLFGEPGGDIVATFFGTNNNLYGGPGPDNCIGCGGGNFCDATC